MTASQQRVYDFICLFLMENDGRSPSVRQIGEGVGYSSSSTVHGILRSLDGLNLIRLRPGETRNIELVSPRPAPTPIDTHRLFEVMVKYGFFSRPYVEGWNDLLDFERENLEAAAGELSGGRR